MALARFGAKRINSYDDTTDTKMECVQVRLHFDQTARSLIRSHWWRFAKTRVQLSQDTTAPTFQWDYAYSLPADFERAVLVYDGSDNATGATEYDYELEGKKLLTNESEVYLKYIAYVADVGAWDSLFTEVFILTLARKLVIPLSQDTKIKADLDRDLEPLLRQVRAIDRQEEYHVGRYTLRTWREAKYSDIA